MGMDGPVAAERLDAALALAAKAGDARAFTELYERYLNRPKGGAR